MAQMYMGGRWVDGSASAPVTNPFDGSTIDTVPQATIEEIDLAVQSAKRGFKQMKAISAFDRYTALMRTVELVRERHEDFARTIQQEEGKTIGEARVEVDRCIQTLSWSAEEAKRLYG